MKTGFVRCVDGATFLGLGCELEEPLFFPLLGGCEDKSGPERTIRSEELRK